MYMLKQEASGMHVFLALLPSLVSLLIGVGYIVFAPKIAGNKASEASESQDILSAGLVLLGVYWMGSGVFQGVGNINFYKQIFDSTRFDLFSNSAWWVACGNFLQAIGGLALIVVGNKMRLQRHAHPKDRF